MQEAKVSVIVPVYNVEKYIDRCISSILRQTYENIELILVDDGSPDKCGDICDEYATYDSRIQVIHRQNGGLSAARNSGLEVATGDYVLFVDSDDYIHPNMIERLYSVASMKKAEVVICDYAMVYENGDIEMPQESGQIIDITEDNRLEYMLGKTKIMFTVAWNKLFKRTSVQKFRFPEGKIHEDEFLIYKILHSTEDICYLREVLYYYFQREDSIIGKGVNLQSLQRLDAIKERFIFYKNQNMMDYCYEMLDQYRYYLNEFILYGYGKYKELKPYRNNYKKYIWKYVWKLDTSLKRKLGLIIFGISPSLFEKLKYIKRKVIINSESTCRDDLNK